MREVKQGRQRKETWNLPLLSSLPPFCVYACMCLYTRVSPKSIKQDSRDTFRYLSKPTCVFHNKYTTLEELYFNGFLPLSEFRTSFKYISMCPGGLVDLS